MSSRGVLAISVRDGFAGTTSGVYDCRMFRSVGAGSNIPDGLSSRRAVPTLSGANSNSELCSTMCLVLRT